MPFAPTAMERWTNRLSRLVVSNTEQFLTNPIPVLKMIQPQGNNQGESKQSDIGIELYILIDRNGIDDGGFDLAKLARPASPGIEAAPASPWADASVGNDHWLLANGKGRHLAKASIAALSQAGVLIAGATYATTFTVSGYVGTGSVALNLGGTAGTSRSANGTFTENINCGAGTDLQIVPTAVFQGDIDTVTIYPTTAPTDLDVKLYACRQASNAFRSTEAFETLVFPSATKTVMRLTRWVPFEEACGGLSIGFLLSGAYAAGNLFASVWSRRFMWGPGL